MNIPVVFYSPNPERPARGYWDMGMLEDIFSGKMWQPATDYKFITFQDWDLFENSNLTSAEGAIVVIPARDQQSYVAEINKRLAGLKWVVLMLTGDEEATFPIEKIEHKNMQVWVMSPRPDMHSAYQKLGTGYPPQAREWLPKYQAEADKRGYDFHFAGQITHKRRLEMAYQIGIIREFKHVNNLNGYYLPTEGFTQGETPEDYYRNMANSKVAFAPSGPETPDSFRLFEALEAGCIPIADTRTPRNTFPDDYWTFFFGQEPPFPVLTDYEQLQGFTIEAVANWKPLSNKIFAWWQNYKRDLCYRVMRDVHILTGNEGAYFPAETPDQKITVVVPTSVIPSHPSTAILEETIEAVRAQLPEAEILITFDGIREQQADRTADYEEYKRRALWLCNNKWHNVLPVIFEEHHHQARMLREVLPKVRTQFILYVEHDAPVTPDRIIEWDKLILAVEDGTADVIRFHHEELCLPEHEHMMVDHNKTDIVHGAPMRRTVQWSQRPHLARVSFYERILQQHFHPDSRTMIEDVMHGVVHQEFERAGVNGWYNYRLWIYCPETDKLGIKRSYHTDGRGADSKYEMNIIPVEASDGRA